MTLVPNCLRQIAGTFTVGDEQEVSHLIAETSRALGNRLSPRIMRDVRRFRVNFLEGDGSRGAEVMFVAPFIGSVTINGEGLLILCEAPQVGTFAKSTRFILIKVVDDGHTLPQVLGVYQSDAPIDAPTALAGALAAIATPTT